MKVRTGFVSNSSTTSFMIYGCAIDRSELIELLGLEIEDEDDCFDELDSALSKALKKTDLVFHLPYEWDSVFIGKSWDTVGDKETGGDFKRSIEAAIEKVLGKAVPCETHAETIEG